MKLRNLPVLLSLAVLAACSPSTAPNTSEDFTDASAQFSDNVSETYAIATISNPPGFDLKWKDPNGIIRSLAGWHDTTVVVTFFRTADKGSDTLLHVFDSVANDLPDSVKILMIDDDNTPLRFGTANAFVSGQKSKSEVLVDSGYRAHFRFAGLLDGQLYYTETFIVRPNGNVVTGTNGNGVIVGWNPEYEAPHLFFDSVVRAAYR